MPDKNRGRVDVNLKASVCTESPDGIDIFPFGDPGATAIANTGIERQGGLTSMYETETAHPTNANGIWCVVAKNGKVVSAEISAADTNRMVLKVDGAIIGEASAYGVYDRQTISGVDDVMVTSTGYMTVTNTNSVSTGYTIFVLNSYSSAGALLATRSLNFGSAITTYGPISFVRYGGTVAFADNQEFCCWYDTSTDIRMFFEATLTSTHCVTDGLQYNTQNNISAYKFENGYYIFINQGNVGATYCTDAFAFSPIASVKWMIIQRNNNKSRALLTMNPSLGAGNLTLMMTFGYTDFASWTAVTDYVLAGVSSLLTYENGYGYCDTRYLLTATGTRINRAVSPQPVCQHSMTEILTYTTTNSCGTDTGINYYGKLTGHYESAYYLSLPFHIRVGLIAGIQSYLSVAYEPSTGYDCLGTTLTGVGEFDSAYYPHTYIDASSTRLAYKYNGKYYYCSIRRPASSDYPLQEIFSNVCKLNSIAPYNIIDAATNLLELGSIDFNGRFSTITISGAGPTATSSKYAATIKGKYSSSIDTGDKLCTVDLADLSFEGIGTLIPSFNKSISSTLFSVDYYVEDIYYKSNSSLDPTTLFVINSKTDTFYIPDTSLPVPIGSTYPLNYTAQFNGETVFLEKYKADPTGISHESESYLIGNNLYGTFTSFSLYGQIYIHDGQFIWACTFDGQVFSSKDIVAPASGMTYVASTPTQIFFLSSFDNSLYTFDGGRTLGKSHRLSDELTITDGTYSTLENTLLLQTASTFLWIRDGVISKTAKKATQTSTKLYSASTGIVISNNTNKWQYGFLSTGTSTVFPFSYQSPYFGVGQEMKSATTTWHAVLYSATKAAVDVTLNCYGITDEGYTTQTEYIHINAGDWASNGFYRCRIQPQGQKAVASSFGFACATKVALVRLSIEYAADEAVIPAASRSR
ncbi:MAG: hypothetical protein WC455_16040 [Dehalococcoidia bacterium]|jgi:hypothetical protein